MSFVCCWSDKMLLFLSKCQCNHSPTACFKFPDKAEEEEKKRKGVNMESAALSPADRNVSTGATAIFIVLFFFLFFVFCFSVYGFAL